MTKCLIQRKRKTSTKNLHEAGLHRDDDWETNRLEVHEVLSVVRHVSRYWTAVGYTQEDQKGRESKCEYSTSTQQAQHEPWGSKVGWHNCISF